MQGTPSISNRSNLKLFEGSITSITLNPTSLTLSSPRHWELGQVSSDLVKGTLKGPCFLYPARGRAGSWHIDSRQAGDLLFRRSSRISQLESCKSAKFRTRAPAGPPLSACDVKQFGRSVAKKGLFRLLGVAFFDVAGCCGCSILELACLDGYDDDDANWVNIGW